MVVDSPSMSHTSLPIHDSLPYITIIQVKISILYNLQALGQPHMSEIRNPFSTLATLGLKYRQLDHLAWRTPKAFSKWTQAAVDFQLTYAYKGYSSQTAS